ncbi:MAG: hypothetical protein IPK98_14320 [Chloracidobacterium sp.]|nr:hypothetical protein [Chloracidobacterium sp.]
MAATCSAAGFAQNIKRVVVVKVDGLPAYYVDQFVKQRDPATGRSVLPWFDEIFYKNGSRVSNFYTRGISLSAPSWSMLDTGQHLQIKGNIEYDRLTKHGYDYLYIVPYYVGTFLRKRRTCPRSRCSINCRYRLCATHFRMINAIRANSCISAATAGKTSPAAL